MATLKMVNGKTYIDPRVNGGDAVHLGDTIEVDDPKAARDILAQSYVDTKDNTRHYFKDVTIAEEEETDLDAQAAAAGLEGSPAKPRRARAAKGE